MWRNEGRETEAEDVGAGSRDALIMIFSGEISSLPEWKNPFVI